MPLEIVRNDIINMQVDAIVNTANPNPVIGYGVDTAIHKKAGPRLMEARKKIGGIAVGQAAATPAFDLDAKIVIHAVGPAWQGGCNDEERLLRQCYDSALAAAVENGCESVAFPLLSAGSYGFPKPLAMKIAIAAFSDFLLEHELHIYLVVFERDVFTLSEKLFKSVASYIDDNYTVDKTLAEYGGGVRRRFGDTAVLPTADEIERFRQLRAGEEQNAEAGKEDGPKHKARFLWGKFKGDDKASSSQDLNLPDRAKGKPRAVSEAPIVGSRPVSASVKAPYHEETASLSDVTKSLGTLLEKTDAGFSETLLKIIDRQGKKDSDVYKKANIDRKLFSKIRNNPDYRPTKATALAFAIALELNLDETKDFIGRAGYALSHSSKFDIIVEYFIIHGNYNVYELNEVLFAFDQTLIGA